MALVPEDDVIAPWYEVVDLPCGQKYAFDRWVWENVVPVLGKRAISRRGFRASFLKYVQTFDNPTICADWYTDLVHFFSMFAGEDHTKSVGFACKAELVLIEITTAKPLTTLFLMHSQSAMREGSMTIITGLAAYFLLATPLALLLGQALKANRRRYSLIVEKRR
jgi:hypothetical protein